MSDLCMPTAVAYREVMRKQQPGTAGLRIGDTHPLRQTSHSCVLRVAEFPRVKKMPSPGTARRLPKDMDPLKQIWPRCTQMGRFASAGPYPLEAALRYQEKASLS